MPDSNLPLLLEVESLADLLEERDDLLIVDLSASENYQEGHIPGAVYLHPGLLQSGRAPAAGRIPDAGRLSEIFSEMGLARDRHVVAYDDEGGGWAARLLWTLEVVGHTHYSYLNGGIHAWRAAGLPLKHEPSPHAHSDFEVSYSDAALVHAEDIMARLDDPGFRIWDARSAAEYRGERTGSHRAGHIPGAVNIDWLELIDRDNAMRLVDLEQLRERLVAVDLGPDKEIVTHCQTHHRSSLSWLVMQLLGYKNARGYDGSWGDWGNRTDTPIET